MTASEQSLSEAAPCNAWRARLSLDYVFENGRTVLARRQHEGPLAVQKSLYPEGLAICHNFVLHPPAGVAGGDELEIEVRALAEAHTVLSTPGAGKWYRSAGDTATQALRFNVGPRAILEWLPQETILYSGAHALLRTHIDLDEGARYLGWEIICMGRPASNERFENGWLRQHTEIHIDGRLRWNEQGNIQGGDALLSSTVGLKGHSICATMIGAGLQPTHEVLTALRALSRPDCPLAVTALDALVVLRHLGDSAQQARECFAQAREILRPWLCGNQAQPLRIWRT